MNKLVLFVFLFFLSACAAEIENTATETPFSDPPVVSSPNPADMLSIPEAVVIQSTTQNHPSGNHIVSGSIDLATAASIDIPLDGTPLWLVSAPHKDSVVFVVVLEDGQTRAYKVSGQQYEPFTISASQFSAGTPPLVTISDDDLRLVSPPAQASSLTNPIVLNGRLIYIASNGDLVLSDSSAQTRLSVNALPDSRILVDEWHRLLVLAGPTNRYAHGVLGDDLEAFAITLIETEPTPRMLQTITVPESDVIEGISAIWADIDGDGSKDVIVTLSNDRNGARIAAFREDGSLLAESDPIGTGYRWRHQIAVAQFEADQPATLVSVRTPHIGGIVEFLRYNNGKLEVVKEVKGFSTHSIGSRNLDSGLAGDFNNDGSMELLAPDQSHTSLAIISMDGVLATIPLEGELTSNLSATEIDGKLYVGAGTQGNLKIWIP